MFRIVTDKVTVPLEDSLLPADFRSRSKHEHRYRHFITNCEQYRHSFLVRTAPEWNLLPEAGIKADTTEGLERTLALSPLPLHQEGLSTIDIDPDPDT